MVRRLRRMRRHGAHVAFGRGSAHKLEQTLGLTMDPRRNCRCGFPCNVHNPKELASIRELHEARPESVPAKVDLVREDRQTYLDI